MLNNKWIVSNKEISDKKTAFLYTLLLMDCEKNTFKTDKLHILSAKNLGIGDFVDCDLNPLNQQYNQEKSDIAIVQYSSVFDITKNTNIKKISFFGAKTGCFDTYLDASDQEFPIRRGDTLSLFMFRNKNNPLNINKKPTYLTFKMMENITLNKKSPYFEAVYNNCSGVLENVITVGIGLAGTAKVSTKKNLFISSPKMGFASSIVSSQNVLFSSRPGDELLIERRPRNNSYEILRNLTMDNMRQNFLINQI